MSDNDKKDIEMFDEFADATEEKLSGFAEQIRGLRSEVERMREEHRSASIVTATPVPTIEVREGPAGKDGAPGRDGINGKDAVFDVDSIIARVSDSVMVRVLEKIPSPVRGEKGDRGEPGQPGTNGERGEDGLSSPDEIRSLINEDRALQWREFFMGVYRPDADYKRGQAVTWNGSFWIATEDTSSKPETDKSWILAVKHGRDARK